MASISRHNSSFEEEEEYFIDPRGEITVPEHPSADNNHTNMGDVFGDFCVDVT